MNYKLTRNNNIVELHFECNELTYNCKLHLDKEMWAEMQSVFNDSDAGSAQKVQPIKKVEKAPEVKKVEISDDKCPECGETLTHEGGCDNCKNCGYSKCN